MSFWKIFNDNNDINEKSVIGFMAFIVMIIFALADIIFSIFGIPLEVNEFIYNSFVFVVLGSFGISEAGKYAKRKIDKENKDK